METLEYLKEHIYKDLENLNTGFDAESVFYFSESDFEIVLDRVEKLGLGISGIEPWLNGEFHDVMVFQDFNTTSDDPQWYKKAFEKFKESRKDLIYSATYQVPERLININ